MKRPSQSLKSVASPGFPKWAQFSLLEGFSKNRTLRALLKGTEGEGLGEEATRASFSCVEMHRSS